MAHPKLFKVLTFKQEWVPILPCSLWKGGYREPQPACRRPLAAPQVLAENYDSLVHTMEEMKQNPQLRLA
jgi:hypothetical protein